MQYAKLKRFFALVILLTIAGAQSIPAAHKDKRGPALPSPICDTLQVPEGHKVAFHTYAVGVQIYKWNGATWDFVGPEAILSASANFRGKVGHHYGGPTWESNSGSIVVGARVDGCTVDPTAIPWLLLRAVSSDGPGIFDGITYIHRVNTTGGLVPNTPGQYANQEMRVPYTAEYYFYRAEN